VHTAALDILLHISEVYVNIVRAAFATPVVHVHRTHCMDGMRRVNDNYPLTVHLLLAYTYMNTSLQDGVHECY
jgi:ectoine hydroxylase-related dioxygenase (phytanoyl-CoA dioxygenase family)